MHPSTALATRASHHMHSTSHQTCRTSHTSSSALRMPAILYVSRRQHTTSFYIRSKPFCVAHLAPAVTAPVAAFLAAFFAILLATALAACLVTFLPKSRANGRVKILNTPAPRCRLKILGCDAIISFLIAKFPPRCFFYCFSSSDRLGSLGK